MLFVLLLALLDEVGSQTACESQHGGSCVNFIYNSCLTGYSYSYNWCGFQEMCCIPPVHVNATVIAAGQCGVAFPDPLPGTNRIVGGSVAAQGEFPWQTRYFSWLGETISVGIQRRSIMDVDVSSLVKLVTVVTVATKHFRRKQKRKRLRQKRSIWTRSWLLRRDILGFYETLQQELAVEDRAGFQNFFRVDPELFDTLLNRISERISKKDTFMRRAIDPAIRLAITLRYLATGDSYKTLQYQFRVASNTISGIIPETCNAIIEAFSEEFLKVSLRAFDAYKNHMCGGILVSDKWILTAAHCFENNKNPYAWNAVLGEYDRTVVDGHEKIEKLETLIVHSGFSKDYGNDIAMLKMATPIQSYTKYIRPVCLPGKTDNFDGLYCTATGWGAMYSGGHGTRTLYKVNLPVIKNDICAYLMDKPIPLSELCAGAKHGGKDTCQGDSGGPLVCQKGGVWKVAGIVSWGYSCAKAYSPGVYTKVSYYRDWINTVITRYSNARKRGEQLTGLHYV